MGTWWKYLQSKVRLVLMGCLQKDLGSSAHLISTLTRKLALDYTNVFHAKFPPTLIGQFSVATKVLPLLLEHPHQIGHMLNKVYDILYFWRTLHLGRGSSS